MSLLEFLLLGGVISIGLILVLTFLLPPIQYLSQRANFWVDATVFHHHVAWFGRLASARDENDKRRSGHEFLNWLDTQVNGQVGGDQVDESLVQAQKLTPLLRYLLQEEIPGSIRRCNSLHRRMALVSGATHMREIAVEPECLGSRRWVTHLLSNTDALLQQYPLNLRIETDDLLNASIIVRKSLWPICRVCPYIQRSVAAASERCPAAELIQMEVKRQ